MSLVETANDNCMVDGCDRERRTLGCCAAHYNQWRTTGIVPTRAFTDAARFYKYVDKKGLDECWPWLAQTKKNGYGKFSIKGKSTSAHRASYEFSNGVIPAGLMIRHTCDNKKCVNPNHLLTGTGKDNARDAVERDLYPRGETQGRARLTLKQVIEIREVSAAGSESQRSMARRFGVSRAAVQHVAAGRTWIGLGDNA